MVIPEFCPGRSCPPALAPDASTSVPPHMPLVPFKVLPWCWSPEGVSWSKSMCRALQKEMHENPFLLPTQPPVVCLKTHRCYGDFSSWHWNPGWVVCCEAEIPHSRDISPIHPPQVGVRQAHSASLLLHLPNPSE